MHSVLLVSCCPLFAEVLQPLHDSSTEEIMTFLIPDIREATSEIFFSQKYLLSLMYLQSFCEKIVLETSFESSFSSDVCPGSGAFLTPEFGIRIRGGKIPDPGSEIRVE